MISLIGVKRTYVQCYGGEHIWNAVASLAEATWMVLSPQRCARMPPDASTACDADETDSSRKQKRQKEGNRYYKYIIIIELCSSNHAY